MTDDQFNSIAQMFVEINGKLDLMTKAIGQNTEDIREIKLEIVIIKNDIVDMKDDIRSIDNRLGTLESQTSRDKALR